MGLEISGESSALGVSPGLASLVTLSKSLPLSEAQFTRLSSEHNQVA